MGLQSLFGGGDPSYVVDRSMVRIPRPIGCLSRDEPHLIQGKRVAPGAYYKPSSILGMIPDSEAAGAEIGQPPADDE